MRPLSCFALFLLCVLPALAGAYRLERDGDHLWLNGTPYKALGLRLPNALMSDASTQHVIEWLPNLRTYGLNTVEAMRDQQGPYVPPPAASAPIVAPRSRG